MSRKLLTWTEEEDQRLLELKTTNPDINYNDLAANFPGKSYHSVYNRWNECLNPDIKKGNWTLEEKEIFYSFIFDPVDANVNTLREKLGNRRKRDVVKYVNALKDQAQNYLFGAQRSQVENIVKNKRKRVKKEEHKIKREREPRRSQAVIKNEDDFHVELPEFSGDESSDKNDKFGYLEAKINKTQETYSKIKQISKNPLSKDMFLNMELCGDIDKKFWTNDKDRQLMLLFTHCQDDWELISKTIDFSNIPALKKRFYALLKWIAIKYKEDHDQSMPKDSVKNPDYYFEDPKKASKSDLQRLVNVALNFLPESASKGTELTKLYTESIKNTKFNWNCSDSEESEDLSP